jgi:hypothetical protein
MAVGPRRVVADVLLMPTVKFSNPIQNFIQMKVNDFSHRSGSYLPRLHGWFSRGRLADRFFCSIFSVHTAISSSMGLISEARRKSCGRFTYSSNNEFLLAFKSSRFFFQTSMVANVARVISVFYLSGIGLTSGTLSV